MVALPAARVDRRVAGEQEEVIDEALQSNDLLEHALVGRDGVGAVGVSKVDFQFGAHPGQRASQLVRGVGDELPLAAAGLLDPFVHVIHGDGESTDLVVAMRNRDATVELGPPDGRDLGANVFDRTQRAADDEPDQRGEHHGGEGTAMDNDVTSVLTLSTMSSMGAARYTMTSPSPVPTTRVSSRASPSMPGT